MNSYLFDINHVSAFMNGNPKIHARIISHSGNGPFSVSMTTVGELWFMVFNIGRVQQNMRRLEAALKDLVQLDFNEAAAMDFRRVKAELRKMGGPIPDPDSQIARINNLIVLTADTHFGYVSNLKTENWLA